MLIVQTRPLQEQIHTLKSKLDEVDLLKADLANLRIQVTEISKAQNNVSVEVQSLRGLSAVVTAMKEEMQQLREALLATSTPPQPSTPKSRTTQLHEAPAYVAILYLDHDTFLHRIFIVDSVCHLHFKTSLAVHLPLGLSALSRRARAKCKPRHSI